jgi:hypothetical protein
LTLATSITQPYLERSKPFFESAVKYWPGDKICFCIGFTCEIEGWNTVIVPEDSLQFDWRPINRKNYYSLQHGEFIDHYKFDPNEIIVFCDSDMLLQRKWDVKLNIEPGGFFVTNSSFPATTLRNVISNIGCSDPIGVAIKYDIGVTETEFCTCFMIASATDWRLLFSRVKINRSFMNYFNHHAAWQLLLNVLVPVTFKMEVLPPTICCADWYSGSPANYVYDTLMVGSKVVYFDHHKFKK